jgi:putative ABC transport system ATP-binding protein
MEIEATTAQDAPAPVDAVRCANLHRRFGEGDAAVDAVDGVDLPFPAGQLTGIVGPSGSGKSTLMHVLAGLDRPTAGQVWIDGTEITALNDKRLTALRRDKLGFVFQFFNLVPVLDAEENVTLPLRIAGRSADPEWLETLLDTVGIADRRTHRPAELSGGQQQRVAIARALITKPAVVFADEPSGNLDSASSTHVLELLRRSVDELDRTVIMVTHDPQVASYADRVVVLVDGLVASDNRVESETQVHELMQVSV